MPWIDTAQEEDLDTIMQDIAAEPGGLAAILSISGVYELVKEEWNNDILDRWREQNAPTAEYLRDLDETGLHTWFERDRAHVELRCALTDESLVEWWDDAVASAVEDGFLDPENYQRGAYDFYAQAWKEGVRDFPITHGAEHVESEE